MKTKVVIIAGSVVLAILIVVAGVLLASEFRSEPDYFSRIAKAQEYYEKGDYDSAILEYKAAIDQDPAQEDAYMGLAAVYRGQGLEQLAQRTLIDGFHATGGRGQIRAHIELYYPDLLQRLETGPEIPEDGGEKDDGDAELVLNVELLQFLSSATYGDYAAKYADLTTTTTGGRCVVRTPKIAADIVFYDNGVNKVINSSTQLPYSEYLPTEIIMDDVTALFGGVGSVDYATLRTINGITGLTQNGNEISFDVCGCHITVSCDDSGIIHRGSSNRVTATGTGPVETDQHTLTGTIVDAATGASVSGAQLQFYAGAGTFGTHYDTTSDYSGRYVIDVPESGNFTVQVSKSGYITEAFQIYVTAGSGETRNNFTISPELSAGEIRIVLTWGSTPRDLDSHLNGTSSDGRAISVSYVNMTAYGNSGQKAATLDVDDTSGYGPETVTIYDVDGSYYFDVTDFTCTSGVGSSGATVKIYQDNVLVTTVVPGANIGLGWRVCSIADGTVTVLNREIATSNGWPVI